MKKFSFRLEKVLRYKKYLEKKAQKRLSETIYEYQNIENTVNNIVIKQKEISGRCSKEKQKGMKVSRFNCYNQYSEKLNDDRKRESTALKEKDKTLQLHRSMLKNELVNRKILEKLKEIQNKRYIEYAEKDEQKQSDEMAITRNIKVTL